MSFKDAIGNPLGFQIIVNTPAYNALASETSQTVYTTVLAEGLWVVNVNNILCTADNNAGGSRVNNYRQTILYDGVVKEQTAIIGFSSVQVQQASIAFIKTDGVSEIDVTVYVKVNDGTPFSIDAGDITFTRIY